METSTTFKRITTVIDRFWYIPDVLMIGLIVVFNAIWMTSNLAMYLCGLYNTNTPNIYHFGWSLLLFLPAAVSLIIMLIRIPTSWVKHIQSPKLLRTISLPAILILPLCFVLSFVYTVVKTPGQEVLLQGLKRHVKAHTDIHAFQAWLDIVDPNQFEHNKFFSGSLDTQQTGWPMFIKWPESITSIHPRDIEVDLDKTGHPMMNLGLGNLLFGSWGLYIGQTTMPTPESQFNDSGSESYLEISPGAYVWFIE